MHPDSIPERPAWRWTAYTVPIRSLLRVLLALAFALSLVGVGAAQSAPSAADLQLFENEIRPLLVKRCHACHGADKQFAGLRLDSRAGLLTGGKSGPAVVPGDPAGSPLLKAVRGETLRMPLDGELSANEIASLEAWVQKGAPWTPQTVAPGGGEDHYSELLRDHWAFQPVAHPAPPDVADASWSENPIDRFLLARLQEEGLKPAPEASRRVLARRLWYLLTGLPPSAEEIRRFEQDVSPDAYERLVDQLLASPQFGERWARHWLDLVRYAETRGYEWNYEVVGAWRYRDYVVRAFNQDVPYDRFVREHIAGDLLDQPRINEEQQINESAIGTAFYRLGEAGHDDCVKFRGIALDVIDNEIDVLSKTFQGLTVACARCHDHKLDPIPTTDYYGLYSVLNSSRVTTHTLDTPEASAPIRDQLRVLKNSIRAELAAVWSREAESLEIRELGKPVEPDAEAPPLEDPSYLLHAIRKSQAGFADTYAAAAEKLREERRSRAAFNAENFEEFVDFRERTVGWSLDGIGLSDGPSPSGDFAIESQGEAAVRGVYPAGRYTHALSARLNGAVRSPWLPRDRQKLSLLAMGGMLGARRTVIDNCAIGEDYKFVDASQPEWITIDLKEQWDELPVFVEMVTRWDNPRIPDRPGRIKKPYSELLDDPESYFGVVRAVLHDGDEPPKAELGHLAPLVEGDAPADWDGLTARYRQVIADAVEGWASGRADDADALWLDWALERQLLTNRAAASADLKSLIERYRALERRLPEPRVAEGLGEVGDGRDFPVLIAGSAENPGQPAPRRFLSRVFGEEPLTERGSGRRELAELIASNENPLTSRVMVNRVWHHLFGRGIVASVDDFGSLGEKPSHPELLDHLARGFMADGWSVKRLIRRIVTSQAFRQLGQTTAAALEVDPQNALLHHFAMRRLSAEEIRDTLLSVAGELEPALYGPSVDPYRKSPKDYRRLFSGPLLGDGRRSLYLKVTRMEGPGFLETFDFPMPSTTRGSRDSTTVPAQSLALLNDPLVTEAAGLCARRVLAENGKALGARVDGLFRIVLAREPSAQERRRFAALADRLATLRSPSSDQAPDEADVWSDLAHVLLTTKEFLYVE